MGTGTAGPAPTELLERDDELAALAAVLAARCGTVVVEGPPGIGKTSLLQACCAGASGALVLHARGSELEEALAFGVVRQLFEQHVAGLSEEVRRRLLAGVAAPAAAVVDPGSPPLLDAADRSPAVVHALSWVLFRMAATQPVVLVVDDAQWADEASQRFLGYVAQRLDGHAVVLLMTQRSSQATADPLLPVRARADLVLSPRLLSLQAVRALVVDRLGESWADAAVACQRATGGNPLYLHHLLGRLRDMPQAPALLRDDDVLTLGAVELVADVDARLTRCGPQARRLATALAALGDRQRLGELAAVAGLDLVAAVTAQRVLAEHGVVLLGEPVVFPHPVVRAAVTRLLPPGAHREAARFREAAGSEVDLVAAHAARELPAGDPWVVTVLREAAQRAVAGGAPGVGLRLLHRALQEPPPPELLPGVLAEAGAAAALVGSADAPALLRRAWGAATAPAERARRALDLARCLGARGSNAAAADVLETALEELGDGDPDLLIALQTQLVVVGLQDVRLVLRTLPAVGALASSPQDPAAREVQGLVHANAHGMGGGSQQQVLDLLLAAPPAADPAAVGWDVRAFTAFSVLSCGGYEEAHRMFAEAADHGRRRGSARALLLASSGWQTSAWLRGDLPTAVDEGRRALDLCLAMDAPDAAVVVSGVLAMTLLDAGDVAEAGSVLAAAPDPEQHPHLMTCLLFSALCRRALASGEADAAVAVLHRGDARFASLLPVSVPSPGMWSWRSPVVEALLRAGDASAARVEAERELEQARAWGGDRALGIALRDLARTSDDEQAAALLAESVAVLRTGAHRLELALSLAAQWGREADAGCRDEALALARRCGAQALVAELGGAPPVDPVARLLTNGERAVVELVAQGLTNAETAARLHLSQATVKTHLLRVFDKLGVRNRTELARRWESRGV